MSDPEVLVVGGGLGGVTAALTAAEHASVQLVAPRAHPFDAHAGPIDVLGYRNGTAVARPFDTLADLPADHTYRTVGRANLRRGLDTFDRAVGDAYAGTNRATNGLVPTAIGGYRPAFRYPDSVKTGLLSRGAELTLVGFDHLSDFDPFHAAERLRALGVPFDVEAVQVTLPFDAHEVSPAERVATAMDENEAVGQDIPIRESVVRNILAQLVEPDRVGFPAVLGVTDAAAIRADLADDLEVPVFEVPLGPPSLLGRRLEIRLGTALEAADVIVRRETDVSGFEAGDSRIRRVNLDDGSSVAPEMVVLATGGLAGGGLEADRDGVREPRFGCHVPHPEDRRSWTEPALLDSHRLAAAGVRIDGRARPRSADGKPAYGNLAAAGRVVGGHDFVAQHAVSGVALATGAAAGRTAVGLD